MYQRANFWEYFNDTSRGYSGVTPSSWVNYKQVTYMHDGHEHTANYCVMYNERRNVIQCFFKETSDQSQWRANFEFWEDYYDSFEHDGKQIQLRVASGWNHMYQALKHHIRDEVRKLLELHARCEIEAIGWSLGSGQAQLCAQDIYYNFGRKVHVFTFGSVKPWYGKNKAMKNYLKQCYAECYNFSEVNDIVTYQPPFSKYFMMNKVKVRFKPFSIFRLFKPQIYHCCYGEPKLYEKIK